MDQNQKRLSPYKGTPLTYTMTSDVIEFHLVSPPGVDINDFNDTLADIIRKEPDAHQRTTNVKAHMTKWNMTRDYPEFKYVADQAVSILEEFYKSKSSLDIVTHLATCWGGLYKKGDYTEPHTHLPGFYNFVYYVKCSEDTAPFVFTDASIPIIPTAGYGIIFPSWIRHEVPEHQSDEERIFITGNIEATGSTVYPQRPWLNT